MKRLILTAAVAMAIVPLLADAEVSISVGQPNFYGRIDLGNAPRPALIYSEPIVVEPPPVRVAPQPVYLHVPPQQAKEWRKYCRKYDACGQPVYFVQETWYNDVYVPDYRRHHARPAEQLYAHDIRADVVRAQVIEAHDIHADSVRARVVYRVKDKFKGKDGADIDMPRVEASEIRAHDIHARVIEADTLYVHKLKD